MAGIGFLLRKLASQDNLSGVLRAFLHSSIVAVGPWMMVVISIGFVVYFTAGVRGVREVNEFLSIFIYNFAFSFIFAAPLYMVSARYVADCLFSRDVEPIPGIMIKSLIIQLIPSTAIATLFYLFYATIDRITLILSITNFGLLTETWIVMLYLSCIRNFRAITTSWFLGLVLSIVLCIYFGDAYGAPGMLFGLNLGLILLLYSLKSNILTEYPYPYREPKEFSFYFRYYRGLFWTGFFLFSGMWIDKVIMWFAPESVIHLNHLRTFPTYDGAMFLSYLTIVPVMGLFIFSLETNFYDSYIEYIQHIERNAPLFLIEEAKKSIQNEVIENGRSFIVLQGSITILVIALAGSLFTFIGFDYIQLGIFRLGALGAFFNALNLIIVILFSYFDSQDNMIRVSVTMFFSNVLLTLTTLYLGFPYYGFGYCFSMIITFCVGAILLARFLDNLTFHIFITNIVKRQSIVECYQERFYEITRAEDLLKK